MIETDKKQLLFYNYLNNIGSSSHFSLWNWHRNLEPDKCGANITNPATHHLQTGKLYYY